MRYYILPIEQAGNARGPKYLKWRFDPSGLDVFWSGMDYGLIPKMLVVADVTTAQHNGLSAQPDVLSLPADIDNTVTSQALPAVQTGLESLKIPGNWVHTSHTYRDILRMVGGLFQFAQRHHGLHDQLIVPDNIDLSKTWGDLPLEWRQNLAATADSFGYDYSGVTASTTIRAILKNLSDQWGDTPINLGLTTL